MASISNVRLEIFENSGTATVRVSYRLFATQQDAPNEQAYRELVQLFGIDTGPGEDGVNEPIPDGQWDDTVVFTTSQVSFVRIREKTLPSSALNEDPGPPIREDEIQARVTLIPLPPSSPSRVSNLVRRGAPVLN
jgi:hypothetical protein